MANNIKLPLIVLAGGLGTRIKSVLGECPKALAPIVDKPFLHLQIEQWLKQGMTAFIFLLQHNAEMIIEFLRNESNGLLKNCQVKYIVEPVPMGTGGAVSFALKQLEFEGDFILTNADTWLSSGVSQVADAVSPSILAVKVKNVGRYGELRFDQQLTVTDFCEKSANLNSGWINAGVSHLNSRFFSQWDGKPFSIETVLYPRLVEKGMLKALPLELNFIDIGVPQDYQRFCSWVSSGKLGEIN